VDQFRLHCSVCVPPLASKMGVR